MLCDKEITTTKEQFAKDILSAKVTPYDLEYLQRTYKVVYGNEHKTYEYLDRMHDTDILDYVHGYKIMETKIINIADTDYAEFARNINATEWVHSGHERFYYYAGGKCPYCQRQLNKDFELMFAKSFDQSYISNMQDLHKFKRTYINESDKLLSELHIDPFTVYPEIDIKPYNDLLVTIKNIIKVNIEKINNKIDRPSKIIKLESLTQLLKRMDLLIVGYNAQIYNHNEAVQDIETKKKQCTETFYALIADYLEAVIGTYNTHKYKVANDIDNIELQMGEKKSDLRMIKRQISQLYGQAFDTTTVKNHINTLLRNFDFQGFRLAEKKDAPNVYEVVRENGKVVKDISEGEKNFLAFLYFYYLTIGSNCAEGETRSKIVVIDDPVSSMDSKTLFIVGSLVTTTLDPHPRP